MRTPLQPNECWPLEVILPTLGQSLPGAAGGGTAVPSLPLPPPIERYLLESPWIVIGALVMAGIIALFIFNQRSKARLGLLALLIAFVLAAAVFVTSTLVTTERERLDARTRELITLTAKAELGALRPILSENVQVRLGGVPFRSGRDAILSDVDRLLAKQYPISSIDISEVQCTIDGPNVARSQVHVRAKSSAAMYDAPAGSWWLIDWRRDLDPSGQGTGEWRAGGINMLQLDFVSDPSQLRP